MLETQPQTPLPSSERSLSPAHRSSQSGHTVGIEVDRIILCRTDIRTIRYSIIVNVTIADITDAIAIVVGLVGIGDIDAVVTVVGNPVAIVVVVTGITDAVAVGICLGGIRIERTVIRAIVYTVAIIIGVADITRAITVQVGLAGIARVGAVVADIGEHHRRRGRCRRHHPRHHHPCLSGRALHRGNPGSCR